MIETGPPDLLSVRARLDVLLVNPVTADCGLALAAAVGTPVFEVCNRAKVVSIKNEAALPFWAKSLEDKTLGVVRGELEGAAIQLAALTAFVESAQACTIAPRGVAQ